MAPLLEDEPLLDEELLEEELLVDDPLLEDEEELPPEEPLDEDEDPPPAPLLPELELDDEEEVLLEPPEDELLVEELPVDPPLDEELSAVPDEPDPSFPPPPPPQPEIAIANAEARQYRRISRTKRPRYKIFLCSSVTERHTHCHSDHARAYVQWRQPTNHLRNRNIVKSSAEHSDEQADVMIQH